MIAVRTMSLVFVLIASTGAVRAEEPKGKTVLDTWHAAYLEGTKSGFLHTWVVELDRDGTKVLRGTTDLNLTVKRFNDTVQLRMETGTEETPDGKVLGVFMRQYIGKDQQLVTTGTVRGNVLQCVVDKGGAKFQKNIPWNDEVLGLAKQERLFQEKKVKSGDAFNYLSYEPTIVSTVNTRVQAKGLEEVEVLGKKRKLLRVESSTDRIAQVDLPPLTVWLDGDFQTVRSEVDMPGLGKMVLYRSTAKEAKELGAGGKSVDIGASQLIPLNQRVSQPYDTARMTYRIRIKGDNDPSTAFAKDGRQRIENVQGDRFDLVVTAKRGPGAATDSTPPPAECLKSCYFINSADDRIRAHTQAAIGAEVDNWRKALRIERWVHDHMNKKNFSEAFATADEVARTLEGDCTEHSMLAAAMCRAAGVPSRTAFGLIYVNTEKGPALGFHMWTEVWIRGAWAPIDATLGKGFVGATHLKISDHTWQDTQSLTPLFPVLRVLGKLSIEVLPQN